MFISEPVKIFLMICIRYCKLIPESIVEGHQYSFLKISLAGLSIFPYFKKYLSCFFNSSYTCNLDHKRINHGIVNLDTTFKVKTDSRNAMKYFLRTT